MAVSWDRQNGGRLTTEAPGVRGCCCGCISVSSALPSKAARAGQVTHLVVCRWSCWDDSGRGVRRSFIRRTCCFPTSGFRVLEPGRAWICSLLAGPLSAAGAGQRQLRLGRHLRPVSPFGPERHVRRECAGCALSAIRTGGRQLCAWGASRIGGDSCVR